MSIEKITFSIESTEIKGFAYKTPFAFVDESQSLSVAYSRNVDSHTYVKKVTFLNMVGRNEVGEIVSYEPMHYVNLFILSKHIEEDKEDSNQLSKGLLHYFDFILRIQKEWDARYLEDYDPILDPPRPSWINFAQRKHQRSTYMYHKALKQSVVSKSGLAKSTAEAYMRAVVNFYKFHIRNGVIFDNPPFEFEIVKLHLEGGESSMKSHFSKDVHTTDLRLNFPKSKVNRGGKAPLSRRDLRPISNYHWRETEVILTETKRVRKNVKGTKKSVSLAIEYCLFFLLLRFSGLRKEEGSSLHLGQIVKPDLSKPMLRLGVGAEYGSLTKGVAGENKTRRTIVPSTIMQSLYEYSLSKRYKRRLEKFRRLCQQKIEEGDEAFFSSIDGVDPDKQYLFLSQNGLPFFLKLTELNNRWNEIRDTVNHNLDTQMEGTIHNLRSTFAVALFRMLLKVKDAESALAIVSECLGHEDLSTTLLYLQIAEDTPTGDEIWEDILDYLHVFKDLDEPESITPNR
ncbi:site-specific integrase [Vibrio brasiliensis]|uniref:site-specific integrase n=1 Tax=Vibrio brasiliensis TaxID=170652 RepID=UPI001EFEB5B5|nr:site-specific integrase [Vibrio brasiliensis]MCG9650345.1 site-specific integrase [Vibrio brasiliensis]